MGGEIQQSKCKEILLGGQKPHLSYIVMTSKPDTITLEKNLVNTGCSPKNSISAQQRKQLKCHKSLNKERQHRIHHPASIQNQDIFVL